MSTPSRTAIVTGASRGIGAAIARRLGADGFNVIVNYASGATQAAQVVAQIEAAGGRARAVAADVTDALSMRVLFDHAEDSFGKVDVLVNNAGISRMSALAQVTDEDFAGQMAVNVTGTFNGMREGAKRIRDGGRIVNLSTSIIGHYQPGTGVYAATKAAVEAMTHTLAKELGTRRITVNAVAPGPVGTDLLLNGRPPEVIQRLVDDIPLGRLGETDDIARIVSFLAGPESTWVNGQVIKANGGRN
ncbi:MAG: SDR family oxidoreductase [Luteibacter sp.]